MREADGAKCFSNALNGLKCFTPMTSREEVIEGEIGELSYLSVLDQEKERKESVTCLKRYMEPKE